MALDLINKSIKRSGGRRFKMALPVLLCFLTLCGCGQKMEKTYDINMGLMRMNSVNTSLVDSIHADGFSVGLAIPGDSSYNVDDITAEAALLIKNDDDDPKVVAFKNPYARTYPASITKVMSALVCLKHVTDFQQEFTITDSSNITTLGSSRAWIRKGETLTIEDLLYGMLLPSGNDAAIAVAEASCGSVSEFVEEMNRTALEIGATGTHFVNPHGLPDDEHYTTPYDIYLIMREAFKYDEFRKIVGTAIYSPHYKDSNGMPKTQDWQDTNKYLIGEVETPAGFKVLGGKTGTTNAAGNCLTMTTQKESTGEEYICTVMKAQSKNDLYSNMTNLILKIH